MPVRQRSPPETSAAPSQPEEIPQPAETEPVSDTETAQSNHWVFPAAVSVVLLFAAALLIRKLVKFRQRQKAVRIAAKEEQIELPDDDSPLEYV